MQITCLYAGGRGKTETPLILLLLRLCRHRRYLFMFYCCCSVATSTAPTAPVKRTDTLHMERQPVQTGGDNLNKWTKTKLPSPPKQSSKKHPSAVYSSSGFVAAAAAAAPAGAAELLCFISTSRGTTSVARWWVLSRITRGALPACCACSHREEHRHLRTSTAVVLQQYRVSLPRHTRRQHARVEETKRGSRFHYRLAFACVLPRRPTVRRSIEPRKGIHSAGLRVSYHTCKNKQDYVPSIEPPYGRGDTGEPNFLL